MEKFRSIAEAVLILSLVIVGGIALESNKAYFCESRQIAMNCNRLSQSAITCYNSELGNKRCTEGWQKFPDTIDISNMQIEYLKVEANGGNYSCNTINGEITSYTRCLKDDGKEAYLGELI